MKIKYFALIILFLPLLIFPQEINLDCENDIQELDTVSISNTKILYRIVQIKKRESNENNSFNKGIILFPNLDNSLSMRELGGVIAKIGFENKVNEFLIFKSCKAIKLFQQETILTNEQEKYMNENFIGNLKFKFDEPLSDIKSDNKKKKTLSKRKKRKKDEMMISISNKICSRLMNVEVINDKIFRDIMINVLSENHEYIYKYYDTMSKEGLKKFTTDILNILDNECEMFKEFKDKL